MDEQEIMHICRHICDRLVNGNLLDAGDLLIEPQWAGDLDATAAGVNIVRATIAVAWLRLHDAGVLPDQIDVALRPLVRAMNAVEGRS